MFQLSEHTQDIQRQPEENIKSAERKVKKKEKSICITVPKLKTL